MTHSENRDIAAGRMEKLRRILRDRHIASVTELQGELHVSPATIRRDMRHLQDTGEISRVHGGAVSMAAGAEEPLFENKESLAPTEKQRIARAAASMIQPKDSVFLDGGSTVLALARLLHDMAGITVVTNSLRVAMELASKGPRLVVVGGEFRRLSQTFVGPLTRLTLEPVHVDTAFMGTTGISAEAGLTTTDPQEAYTKGLVVAHARQVVLLADRTKIGRVSFARFGALEEIDILITDGKIDPDVGKALRKNKARIVTV